jgi:hypothetical protein
VASYDLPILSKTQSRALVGRLCDCDAITVSRGDPSAQPGRRDDADAARSTGSALSSRFDFFSEITRAHPGHARSSGRSPRPAPSSSSVHAVPLGWHLATRRPTRSRSSNGPLSRSLLLRRRGAMGKYHPARASGAAVCERRFYESQTS